MLSKKQKRKISKRPRQRHVSTSKASPEVFSYHSNRTQPQSETSAALPSARAKHSMWHRLVIGIASLAVVISAAYTLTLNANVSLISLNSANICVKGQRISRD